MAGNLNLTRLSAWAILFLGLALSGLAHRFAQEQLKNEAQAKFERQSREIHRAIASRLSSYTGLLWGLRGLYHASGTISAREFRDYVRGLELSSRYPAVVSINYAEQISLRNKAALERRVRADRSLQADGYPGFRILPPGNRDRYQVLLRLEPFQSKVFGTDLEQLPNPRFDEIAASGDFVSSGELVSHQPGLPLALRLAVYQRDLPLHDAGQRQQAFRGSLGMGFSLLKLIQEAVSAESLGLIRIRIHNIGRAPDIPAGAIAKSRSLLIDTAAEGLLQAGAADASMLANNRLSTHSRLDFGGAALEFSFDGPAAAFAAPHRRYFPGLVLGAGVTVSLLLSLLVGGLLRSKHKLEHAVADRSSALLAANRALEEEIAERNRLEREVMRGLVDERRRFGQELHDNLGQHLTAAAFQIEILRRELDQGGYHGSVRVDAIEQHLSSVAEQVRQVAHGLNPVAENTGGLASALQRLAEEVSASPHRRCTVRFFGEPVLEEISLEHNLFRMARQAVAGAVARHAYQIQIELRHDAAGLALQINDNGDSFAASTANRSVDIGVRFIRYRCNVLGLTLHIAPLPDGGTMLRIGRSAASTEAAA